MNQRTSPRISVNLPVKLHFFEEHIEVTVSEDISNQGFLVRTPTTQTLDKGLVAVVSFEMQAQLHHYLAEVVRISEHGTAFRVIEDLINS